MGSQIYQRLRTVRKIKYGFCYGKTYKEAKEKVTKCKAAMVTGQPIPKANGKHRFAFYCDGWLNASKGKLKESTAVKYSSMLEKHIKPKLGGCFPLGLTSGLIDNFRDELLFEDELSPKTVKDVLVLLRTILRYTAKQFPNSFPQIDITYPRESKKEMRVFPDVAKPYPVLPYPAFPYLVKPYVVAHR